MSAGGGDWLAGSPEKPILAVKGLSYSYGDGKSVLSDISFRVPSGCVLSILGPNGAGKSTLLGCIAGFLTPRSGDILIGGVSLSSLGQNERALNIAYVEQLRVGTFDYSVRDYVVMGRAPYVSLLQTPGAREYEIVDSVLEGMGISHLASKSYREVSGGERQQIEIARAIVQESRIMLLDEPANHLDLGNQMKTIAAIRQLSSEGKTVVFTTHNPDHCMLVGGLVAVLSRDGEFVFGPVEEVLTESLLRNLYKTSVTMEYSRRAGRVVCFASGRGDDWPCDEAEIQGEVCER